MLIYLFIYLFAVPCIGQRQLKRRGAVFFLKQHFHFLICLVRSDDLYRHEFFALRPGGGKGGEERYNICSDSRVHIFF